MVRRARRAARNGAVAKRVVSLAAHRGIDLPTHERLVASFTSGDSLCDPTEAGTGSTDGTYRLPPTVEAATLESTAAWLQRSDTLQ